MLYVNSTKGRKLKRSSKFQTLHLLKVCGRPMPEYGTYSSNSKPRCHYLFLWCCLSNRNTNVNRAVQKKNSNQCWERMRWKAENRGEGATFVGQPGIERKPGWWINKNQAVSTNLPWVWNRNSSLNTLQSSLPAWLWPRTTPEGLPKHPGEAGGGRWKQRHEFTSFYKFWKELFLCSASGQPDLNNYMAL